ncbi:hypothetical protein DIRU0_D32066 [Diutina rugosa]
MVLMLDSDGDEPVAKVRTTSKIPTILDLSEESDDASPVNSHSNQSLAPPPPSNGFIAPGKCSVCGRYVRSWERHVRLHSGDDNHRYVCKFRASGTCTYKRSGFASCRALRHHMLKHHFTFDDQFNGRFDCHVNLRYILTFTGTCVRGFHCTVKEWVLDHLVMKGTRWCPLIIHPGNQNVTETAHPCCSKNG